MKQFIPEIDPCMEDSPHEEQHNPLDPNNWSQKTWDEARALPNGYDFSQHGMRPGFNPHKSWSDCSEEEDEALCEWMEDEGQELLYRIFAHEWDAPKTITLTPLQLMALLCNHRDQIREIDAEDRLRAHEAGMVMGAIEEFDGACPSCDTNKANNA